MKYLCKSDGMEVHIEGSSKDEAAQAFIDQYGLCLSGKYFMVDGYLYEFKMREVYDIKPINRN